MRRFRAPHLPPEGGVVELDDATSHHLLRVVGIAPGEHVELFDGRGHRALARLEGTRSGSAVLHAQAPLSDPLPPQLVAVLGLTKGPAMDDALRMVTEIGATDVLVVWAARSVARGDRRDRWERVVASAAEQSHRSHVPVVHAPMIATAAAATFSAAQRFVTVPGAPLRHAPSHGPVAVAIGPEGGWTEEETATFVGAGWTATGLGHTVLRADTAAAVALATLRPQHH